MRWSVSRDEVPLYLVSAATIATAVSITAFEVLMGLALVAMIVMRKRWRLPDIWIPLALFIFGTLVSLAVSGHVRRRPSPDSQMLHLPHAIPGG